MFQEIAGVRDDFQPSSQWEDVTSSEVRPVTLELAAVAEVSRHIPAILVPCQVVIFGIS